ncbi:ABC transporter substrate-binding protein [Paenibacillus montaniterrae]|uniref:ABC transporter substrate-binding protein n=1 Tax=Paenibacillus montaniterrae TaxID=429341 RepID=A0A919YRV1_9BACL|nr:extracellular solute-binding protein [Paenibacillus montaniterrae]GIP18540.1 ABC transporter substrate-binding protein [Paenibacillus montaniterrae]
MKKIASLMTSLTLVAALLAGCGSGGNGGNGASSPNSTDSNVGSGGKSVTLKVFIAQPRFKEQYDKLAADFTAMMKETQNTDVTVQLELPNSDNAAQILKTRLASNDAPDVFSLHAINELPTFYKAGYLEDLSDQPFVDVLLEDVKKSVTTTDGKVVGVPLETMSWGYLYNKDLFEQYKLEVPTTVAELREVAEQLKANGETPFLLSYKEAWIPQLVLPLAVGALMKTGNEDFVDRMNKDEGSFQEMKEMFTVFDLISEYGTDRALEVGGDDGAAKFAAGEAAMWLQGPWYAETILKSNPDMSFGVAPLPINDDPNATLINLSASTTLAVSQASKQKDVAKAFLNFVMSEEYSSGLFESLMFNPTATVHTYESYPWVDDATVYVKEGKAYQDPSIPQAVKDEVGKGLQSYFAGQMTQDEVLDALDKAWKSFNKVNQ